VEKSDFIHRNIQTITDYPTLFSHKTKLERSL